MVTFLDLKLKYRIMNVIYLNKNLQYCEVFPDKNGNILIDEKNLIVGFVDKGMLWALKDDDSILTPFETFAFFNDMSVEFIQAQHFQGAQRVINLDGKNFCELKQVFNCATFYSPFSAMFNELNLSTGHQTLVLGISNFGEMAISENIKISRTYHLNGVYQGVKYAEFTPTSFYTVCIPREMDVMDGVTNLQYGFQIVCKVLNLCIDFVFLDI